MRHTDSTIRKFQTVQNAPSSGVDDSPCSAFELRGTSIHDSKTGKLICTIWPERKASDEREEGESWLAMRDRTDPEREAIEQHTEQRAASVCAFLNSQNAQSLPPADTTKNDK